MKSVAFFALLAVAAAADVSNEIVGADNNNEKGIEVVAGILDQVDDKVSGVAARVAGVSKNIMDVDALMGNAAELDAKLPTIQKMLKMQSEQTVEDVKYKLSVAKMDQDVHLAQELGSLHADVALKTAELESASNNLAADTASSAKKLASTTKTLIDRLNAHKNCAKSLRLYDAESDECRDVSLDTAALSRRVTQRNFNNDDGRDSGYISNRYIKFTKKHDDTYMRVFYHDNMRVHGHTAHARWNIMVCDGNGNGCDHCNNPGRLQYWRYSNHQHNWWMNDHWSGGISGMCRSAGNRNLKKGTYQFRVMIDNNRYDIYTGHTTDSSLMVDEVMRV